MFFSSPGFLPKLSCKQEFPHIKHIWSILSAHSSPLPQCWFRFIQRRLPSVQLLAGLPDGTPKKFHNSSCVPHCLQGKVQMQNPTPSALRLTVESDSPLPSAHQWTHSDHWLRALSPVSEPLSQGYHCMKLLSPPCSLKHCLLLVIFLTILLPSFPFLADWGVHLCPLHYSIIIVHFLPWLCF